jgi:putative Mg2+ transporter-C (MgtC) family protein
VISILLEELASSLPDTREAVRVFVRLVAALIAGAVIGLQRERSGKAAGLRTHMLVSLGTVLFVIAGAEIGMEQDALSRVIQGLATGIGFIGAGAILKMESERAIRGLTTAAGIWMTAAIAVAIGVGHLGTAAIGVLFAWIVLALVIKLEPRIDGSDDRA